MQESPSESIVTYFIKLAKDIGSSLSVAAHAKQYQEGVLCDPVSCFASVLISENTKTNIRSPCWQLGTKVSVQWCSVAQPRWCLIFSFLIHFNCFVFVLSFLAILLYIYFNIASCFRPFSK